MLGVSNFQPRDILSYYFFLIMRVRHFRFSVLPFAFCTLDKAGVALWGESCSWVADQHAALDWNGGTL